MTPQYNAMPYNTLQCTAPRRHAVRYNTLLEWLTDHTDCNRIDIFFKFQDLFDQALPRAVLMIRLAS